MGIDLVRMLSPSLVGGSTIEAGGTTIYGLAAVCEHGTLVAAGAYEVMLWSVIG